MFVVVRGDLSPGQVSVQVAHAIAALPAHDPAAFAAWRAASDSLVVLTVTGEQQLLDVQLAARQAGASFVAWREQDLGDEVTAVAFLPSTATAGLLVGLPLAGRVEPPAGTVGREAGLRRLTAAMRGCEQMPGMDVLEHGRAVRETYLALLDHVHGRVDLRGEPGWRLPAWLSSHADRLAVGQVGQAAVERYLTLHDCGKPRVRVLGDDGRSRFPGHVEASVRAYRKALGRFADPLVAELIGADMLLHVGSAQEVSTFASSPLSPTLALAAVAEVHANAAMFGGIDSVSFKAKIKRVDQRGRALLRAWEETGWPAGPAAATAAGVNAAGG